MELPEIFHYPLPTAIHCRCGDWYGAVAIIAVPLDNSDTKQDGICLPFYFRLEGNRLAEWAFTAPECFGQKADIPGSKPVPELAKSEFQSAAEQFDQ